MRGVQFLSVILAHTRDVFCASAVKAVKPIIPVKRILKLMFVFIFFFFTWFLRQRWGPYKKGGE
jgi:hypothetical protein